MTESETSSDMKSGRNMGVSLALQLLVQALIAVIADMAPDADDWRLKLSATLKSEVLRSTVENTSQTFLDSMAHSANDTLDFLIFGRDGEVEH